MQQRNRYNSQNENRNSRSQSQARGSYGRDFGGRDSGNSYEGIHYGRPSYRSDSDNYESTRYGSDRDYGNTSGSSSNRENLNRDYDGGNMGSTGFGSSYGSSETNRMGGNYGNNNYGNGNYRTERNDRSDQTSRFGNEGIGRERGYGSNYNSNSAGYPSTERNTPSDRQAWQGNPSMDSSYGGSYLNWGSETNDINGTHFSPQNSENSYNAPFRTGAYTPRETHYGRGPKNYKRSDERIQEDASEAITADHDVDGTDIQIDVADGVVTLAGSVPDRKMKRAAEDCVEKVTGVKDVKNDLTVSPKTSSSSTSTGSGTSSESTSKNTRSKLQ